MSFNPIFWHMVSVTYRNFLFQVRIGSTKCSASRQCSYRVQCISKQNEIRVHCSLFTKDFIRALGILANNIVKCAVSTLFSWLGRISFLWKGYFHNSFHSQSGVKGMTKSQQCYFTTGIRSYWSSQGLFQFNDWYWLRKDRVHYVPILLLPQSF